ncbi:carbohydrate ABC transporter permease [Bacillus sp. FJAT-50079]|uniref:carbohydrate ABC transporter permease n=1 Tax=Bacillus sp. FJAT-50079 TaxID=2833577 RepID=UPI001BC9B53A|nr:carbohydrate ABC transporter permease [Bacillus sp. FJAT-50079]MBS4206871.1 carbohydrate ABC transporter permease [Bacillus sp. FJAT-50079]
MKKIIGISLTILTYLIAFIYFFPILWILITGFKNEADAVIVPPSLFFEPTLENYKLIWDLGVKEFFVNSVIVTIITTFLSLLLGVPAAYALAMFKVKKGNDLLFWYISTKFLPIAGVIIPIYLIFKNINLLDSLLSLIILYSAMNIPIIIWMMRTFFLDISNEIIESAEIDGATGLECFFKIVLPLVRPGLISTALLCMVFAWNEFFFGITLTYTTAGTLPVYMASFMTQEGLFWAKMSAAATISILPVLVLGWFTQKQLVQGLTAGAVKG